MPKFFLSIFFLLIFISCCTPINITKQSQVSKKIEPRKENILQNEVKETTKSKKNISDENINSVKDKKISTNITVVFSNNKKKNFTKQLVNILELAVFNKKLENVNFEISYFDDEQELINIITKSKEEGKIYIGLTETKYTKIANKFCDNETIFFTFSSDITLANQCIYLLNFFPKNELEQLFLYLEPGSKVALLYPENNYGYSINLLIDEIANSSDAIIVNRSSYKKDLSNVRDAIKELGKYELRKYELERQKQILYSNNDKQSKKRLKKLEKFRTTNDYDFTHILIADYGLNLLQVAPLLPYYDIDPNIVQFLGTGVIDDENFFIEPSLQGAIFPGVEKSKRIKLINQYKKIYDENLLRISTLPFDLVGLLNFIFSNNLTLSQTKDLLNNDKVTFDGIDGEFYFKDNMIKRNLDILKIYNGSANKIN